MYKRLVRQVRDATAAVHPTLRVCSMNAVDKII
jgi:hypothetical protein